MASERKKLNLNKKQLLLMLTAMLSVPIGIYIYNCPYVAEPMYNFVLFHPIKHPFDQPYELGAQTPIHGYQYADVFFPTNGGNRLHGWYLDVPKAKYAFLLCHGNGGNLTHRRDVMNLLAGTDCSVLAFDYRGYGRSEGSPSIDRVCEDAFSAFNFLSQEKHFAPDHIIIFGESLGTSIGGNLASKVKCAGVILQSPIASVRRRGVELFSLTDIYPELLWPQRGLSNLGHFRNGHAPLLLIGGTKDPMIPIKHGDDIFASASQPKWFVRIEGAGHTGDPRLMKSPDYMKALLEFVQRLDANSNGETMKSGSIEAAGQPGK